MFSLKYFHSNLQLAASCKVFRRWNDRAGVSSARFDAGGRELAIVHQRGAGFASD
jgi:hypothetical protein